MAAIDKLYVNTIEEYKLFKNWCEAQPPIIDKYGVPVKITSFMYDYDDDFVPTRDFPVFNAPYYVDAYVIRNCPYNFIQKELMLRYGYETEDDIREKYNYVINRTKEEKEMIDNAAGSYPKKPIPYWWMTVDDFIVNGDSIDLKNKEKSEYEAILDNEIYTVPTTNYKINVGHHVKILSYPIDGKRNHPYKSKCWDVTYINTPKDCPSVWNHTHKCGKYYTYKYGTFDYGDEFVHYDSATTGFVKWPNTIKALIRMLRKINLPVGTIVEVQGAYVGDEYKLLITK